MIPFGELYSLAENFNDFRTMAFYTDQIELLRVLHRRKRQRIRMMQYIMVSNEKRKHRCWVHEILQKRPEHGAYYHLVRELQLDADSHHAYFRISAEKLEFVLSFVGPAIQKRSMIREPIEAKQRLAICIRFLATGESYTSLSTQYRVGVATISRLVPEVCDAIWETMRDSFLKMPQTTDEWKLIAHNFMDKWDFPHCVGAIDGKHIVIKSPMNSGSMYYNYKSTYSIILMALADVCNMFIAVDIGAYGRQLDAGVFSNSEIGHALATHDGLNLPTDEPIPGAEHLGPMPYVVVGDEAFPLQKHVMRPYPGRHCNTARDAYNYRLSRARRIVECTFGIFATRWRVFYTRMAIHPINVIKVVQAAVILHNMMQRDSTPGTSVEDFVSDYRPDDVHGLVNFAHFGTRGSATAVDIRDRFTRFFTENPLPWQNSHIQRGLH